MRSRQDCHGPARIKSQSHLIVENTPLLDEERHRATAAQPAPLGFSATTLETGPIGQLQTVVEQPFEFAAVIHEAGLGGIGHRFRADQIATSNLYRVETYLDGCFIHEPLD